jgi:hypothetical protein
MEDRVTNSTAGMLKNAATIPLCDEVPNDRENFFKIPGTF